LTLVICKLEILHRILTEGRFLRRARRGIEGWTFRWAHVAGSPPRPPAGLSPPPER
jgi:hypothetical protein